MALTMRVSTVWRASQTQFRSYATFSGGSPSLYQYNRTTAQPVHVFDFTSKLTPYTTSLSWQRDLQKVRATRTPADDRDVLLLVQHPPVFTLGRSATLDNVKFTDGQYELHRVERGGEVTHHCPGQLVGYPILNLNHYKKDLHWYLRAVEDVLLQVLGVYGLQGDRDPDLTGVWYQGHKLAAVGIHVSRWITAHGFALNVHTDMAGFKEIVPCGIADKPVGSLHQFVGVGPTPSPPTISDARDQVVAAFERVFHASCTQGTAAELDDMLDFARRMES